MSTWMKKVFTADGVTEWTPGPRLPDVVRRFSQSGAVVLLLDVSSSMDKNLREAVAGCRGFIDEAVSGGYEVGIILWNHDVQAVSAIDAEGASAGRLLRKAKAGGGTHLEPALLEAASMLSSHEATDKVIVIFCDGLLQDQSQAVKASRRVRNEGIRIITMGLGAEAALMLQSVASPPERGDGGPAEDGRPEGGRTDRSPALGSTREARAASLAGDITSLALDLKKPSSGR